MDLQEEKRIEESGLIPTSYSENEILLDLIKQVNFYLSLQSGNDFKSVVKLALKQARDFLDVELLCMYRAKSGSPEFTKYAEVGEGSTFPIILAKTNLAHWMMESSDVLDLLSVFPELQTIADAAGLNSLVCAPIGEPNALTGVLVTGSPRQVDLQLLNEKMKMIGMVLDGIIQKNILLKHTQLLSHQIQHYTESRDLVFTNTKDGVLILDREFKILEVNVTAEQMLGYSLKEIRYRSIEEVLIGADGLADALEAASLGIETRDMGLVSLHRRNGQAVFVHIQSFPLFDEMKFKGVVILISDESENEQNRIKVQHLEQRAALGSLSAIFAHEVRNPINNISTGVQLLKSRTSTDDPNYDAFTRIQNDCGRLSTLMDSVLSFSKPIEPKLTPLDVVQQLANLLERWRPRLDRLNINYFLRNADNVPLVMGDHRLLEQVFTNLISNASEAMEKTGGSLVVKISRNEIVPSYPQVEIAISDTGPGIPDDIIDKIFEPFVSTKPKGTGLGLALTKHIVTAQRGTIHVNSFAGGTVFFINLPQYRGE